MKNPQLKLPEVKMAEEQQQTALEEQREQVMKEAMKTYEEHDKDGESSYESDTEVKEDGAIDDFLKSLRPAQ